MRRPLEELAPSTVQAYRSRARKLWLKVQAGQALTADRLELVELEALLPGYYDGYRDTRGQWCPEKQLEDIEI